MVAKGLKSLFQRNSPFAIKPRLDPAFWSWLLPFRRRCNERDMIAAGRGIQPLLLDRRWRSTRTSSSANRSTANLKTRGLLFAYRSKAAMEAYAATDRLMGEAFHCPARAYDGDAAGRARARPRPGLAGGWYYHDDAHLRPDKLMRAWRRVLEAGGATIRENCAFQRLSVRHESAGAGRRYGAG